jgi:predicted O-linked N-acetylglucosamine transferase (SPINDLY family)
VRSGILVSKQSDGGKQNIMRMRWCLLAPRLLVLAVLIAGARGAEMNGGNNVDGHGGRVEPKIDHIEGEVIEGGVVRDECRAKMEGISMLGRRAYPAASLAFVRATAECPRWGIDEQIMQGLGEALHSQGDVRQALRAFRAALRTLPSSIDLANNVGAALIDAERPLEASELLRATRARIARQVLSPGDDSGMWKTLVNLASALTEGGMPEESAAALQEAKSLQRISQDMAAVATVQLHTAMRRLCRWQGGGGTEAASEAAQVAIFQLRGHLDAVLPQSALPVDPYLALGLPLSPQDFLLLARHYASLTLPAARLSAAAPSPLQPSAQLKIAYVGSEFGRHHSIMLLMRGVFGMHKATAVCFGLQEPHPGVEPPTCTGGFRDLSRVADDTAAEEINRMRPHVVVDLNGWTAGHRAGVLASRPARLQVQYMGFPATTGALYVDFAVSDRFVTPPELRPAYSEAMLLMPVTYFVSDYGSIKALAGADDFAAARKDQKQGAGSSVTMCNHDSHHKFDQQRFRSWMDAMDEAKGTVGEGARLELLRQGGGSERSLLREAETRGVEVRFVERVAFGSHMQRIRGCGVAVDTDGICGHTTAANYLYSRVPMVTRATEHQVGRVAAGLILALSQHCGEAAAGIVRVEADFARVASRIAAGSHSDDEMRSTPATAASASLRSAARSMRARIERCLESAVRDRAGVWDTGRWVRDWESGLRMALETQGLGFKGEGKRGDSMNVVVS